jgi:hypothetical protein
MNQFIPNEIIAVVVKLKALVKLQKAGCVHDAISRVEAMVAALIRESA